MKFIRSLPLMWARTRWPFSSSTANIVFGQRLDDRSFHFDRITLGHRRVCFPFSR